MKTLAFIALLCVVVKIEGKKQIGCKVAAYCEYADGTSRQEYRPFPNQKQANAWAKITGPETEDLVVTPSCSDPGWFNGPDGYQYMIFNGRADWLSARDLCRSQGAELAYDGIKNPKNMEFITESFLKQHNYEGYWIGLSDRKNEGDWRWIDRTKLKSSQESWQSGQPDNSGEQDCAYISRTYGYKWDDGDCTAMFPILCERKM